jgi:signal transduction histidine kinase
MTAMEASGQTVLALSSGSIWSLLGFAVIAGTLASIWQQLRVRKLEERYRQLRTDLTAANERAASLRGEKVQILRVAVQEIATPVQQLGAHLDSLANGTNLPHEQLLTIQQLQGDLKRVQSAVQAFEQLQTLETRSRSAVLTSVNVGAIVIEAITSAHPAADAKRVRLSSPASAHTCLAQADPQILRKALENLMRDAIEVTPAGGTVAISVYRTSDRVLVTVADEGPGTAVADQAMLLDQSGNSRPPFDGSSVRLNLAMVHNLVKAMQGYLWSQGDPGRGTTHVIELALAEPKA